MRIRDRNYAFGTDMIYKAVEIDATAGENRENKEKASQCQQWMEDTAWLPAGLSAPSSRVFHAGKARSFTRLWKRILGVIVRQS